MAHNMSILPAAQLVASQLFTCSFELKIMQKVCAKAMEGTQIWIPGHRDQLAGLIRKIWLYSLLHSQGWQTMGGLSAMILVLLSPW